MWPKATRRARVEIFSFELRQPLLHCFTGQVPSTSTLEKALKHPLSSPLAGSGAVNLPLTSRWVRTSHGRPCTWQVVTSHSASQGAWIAVPFCRIFAAKPCVLCSWRH